MTAPPSTVRRARCWPLVIVIGFGAAGCGTGAVGQATVVASSSTIAAPSALALQTVRSDASRTTALSATVSLDFAGLSGARDGS